LAMHTRLHQIQALILAGVVAGVFAVHASAQVPIPGQGSSRPRPAMPADAAQGPIDATLPVFEFHSGLWINLHHFLYQQARLRTERPVRRASAAPSAPSAIQPADLSGLNVAERRAWEAGLEYYAREFAGRDILFDGDLVAIKNRLAEWESESDLQTSGLKAELIAALEQAAGVYRAHWWALHDLANRDWMAGVAPLVRRHGAALARELARAYQAPWPAERIRVDVSVYAHWVGGAYTTLSPLHVTLSSIDARNQGLAALEILFHEASHGMTAHVRDNIARECRARNKPIPRDLWHALLFYTTGEMVKHALKAATDANSTDGGAYTPYAQRHGLYARGWQNFQELLERHWQPYLDGKVEFERAIARMVAAL